jgi:arylsulfatase
MRDAIERQAAPDVRTTQYFEMLGSRAIIHDGWKATTDHIADGVLAESALPGSRDLDQDRWNLFRLEDDFAEAHDLADANPEVVADLERVWWAEAEANQVLPLQDSLQGRVMAMVPPLWPIPLDLVLRPGGNPLADEAVPSLALGALVEADIEVPAEGGSGVLAAMGDWSNGWALVVLGGAPCFLLNTTSTPAQVRATRSLSAGGHRVGFRYLPDRRVGVLFVDAEVVASAILPQGIGSSGLQIGGGGLRVGHDAGFPVSDAYRPPFPWNGTLHTVRFEQWPAPLEDLTLQGLATMLRRE